MFEPLTRKFIDWRQRRVAVRRLRQMDDHLLADLGTSRDGIELFVLGCRGTCGE